MNDQTERWDVTCDVCDERTTPGFLIIKKISHSARTTLVIKKLSLFWGLAVISILIPVFHFVLVPLFFILGVFLARRASKSEGFILEGGGTCPHCGIQFHIKASALQWPLSEICQNCARVVRIKK